jgi:hypothetical protein
VQLILFLQRLVRISPTTVGFGIVVVGDIEDLRVLFSLGAEFARMVKPPPRIPPPPIPAIARPIMRAADVGATPQIREPISKIMIKVKKVY